jgi:hypothetical protein
MILRIHMPNNANDYIKPFEEIAEEEELVSAPKNSTRSISSNQYLRPNNISSRGTLMRQKNIMLIW